MSRLTSFCTNSTGIVERISDGICIKTLNMSSPRPGGPGGGPGGGSSGPSIIKARFSDVFVTRSGGICTESGDKTH